MKKRVLSLTVVLSLLLSLLPAAAIASPAAAPRSAVKQGRLPAAASPMSATDPAWENEQAYLYQNEYISVAVSKIHTEGGVETGGMISMGTEGGQSRHRLR